MTNGEFVSAVINSVRTLNKDEHISRRYILRRGREKAKFYLSQKLNEGTLLQDSSLFTTLNCVELEEVDLTTCSPYIVNNCSRLMRTKDKIEGLITSRYTSSIVRVTTIDNQTPFFKTTQYNESLSSGLRSSRPNKKDSLSYYEEDGYVYFPNTDISFVNITLITLEEDSIESCESCDSCKSIWDYPFTSSDRFKEQIIQETINEVAGVWRRISPDENPNLTVKQ